jgi:hypothetical protein
MAFIMTILIVDCFEIFGNIITLKSYLNHTYIAIISLLYRYYSVDCVQIHSVIFLAFRGDFIVLIGYRAWPAFRTFTHFLVPNI